jgi:hypothetical protein
MARPKTSNSAFRFRERCRLSRRLVGLSHQSRGFPAAPRLIQCPVCSAHIRSIDWRGGRLAKFGTASYKFQGLHLPFRPRGCVATRAVRVSAVPRARECWLHIMAPPLRQAGNREWVACGHASERRADRAGGWGDNEGGWRHMGTRELEHRPADPTLPNSGS